MNEVLYNQQEAEAMLCLWEAMLEERDNCPALQIEFDTHGTVFMRFEAMHLAQRYLKVWEQFTPDERDGITYDWEFWPAVVNTHDWECGTISTVDYLRALLVH